MWSGYGRSQSLTDVVVEASRPLAILEIVSVCRPHPASAASQAAARHNPAYAVRDARRKTRANRVTALTAYLLQQF